MYFYDEKHTKVDQFANAMELVVSVKEEEGERPKDPAHNPIEFEVPIGTKLLIIASSAPDGDLPPWLNVKFKLDKPDNSGELNHKRLLEPIDQDNPYDQDSFANESSSLIIVLNPDKGKWTIGFDSGDIPFVVNIGAYCAVNAPNVATGLRCTYCKNIMKALAVAIVSSLTLPFMPATTILAVQLILHLGHAMAIHLIYSFNGKKADEVAEILCKHMKYC